MDADDPQPTADERARATLEHQKQTLHRYLVRRRDDLLRKLDGLDDYDVARPLVPTGTSLLGLVKHVGSVQLGYFGEVFGRPADRTFPWIEAGDDTDMYLEAGQTRAEIEEFYAYSARWADATIEALPLDARGEVPWWPPERREVTLHQILVHMLAEAARHAGHADILRETIDGAAGDGPGDPNLPQRSAQDWAAFRERIEANARAAAGRTGTD
jgi:uncharacterized damage-inducible protein DinB